MEYIVNAEDENHLFYGDKYERLIRCKDCKFYSDHRCYASNYYSCMGGGIHSVKSEDYCSWAKMKGGNE